MEHDSDSSYSVPDYAETGCRVREARAEYVLTQDELAQWPVKSCGFFLAQNDLFVESYDVQETRAFLYS
jgi:hypothetical protein